MAEYLIQDTTLTAIADAIRSKTGGTEAILPENMAAAITGLSGDFDITDENLKYFVYRFDADTKQVFLYQILYDILYELTGSYNVSIPNKIAGFDVVIVNS